MTTSGDWFVIFLVVYQENYDAPWAQFVASGISAEDAARCAADTESLTTLERSLPVHMKRGGQTRRYVFQVRANDGLTALLRVQTMLSMDTNGRRQFQSGIRRRGLMSDPLNERVDAMLGMLRRFRSEALEQFGEHSALADLISDEIIGWFSIQADEQQGHHANIVRHLDDVHKHESSLLDVNRNLRDQIRQVVAERGNLERIVVEQKESSDRQIRAFLASVSILQGMGTALYETVGRLQSRAATLREMVVVSWLAGLKLEPEQLRPLVAREGDELKEILAEYLSVVHRDWTTIPPSTVTEIDRESADCVVDEPRPGRVVEGAATIRIRVSSEQDERSGPPDPCPPDCATTLGHSHAFAGDGDAG